MPEIVSFISKRTLIIIGMLFVFQVTPLCAEDTVDVDKLKKACRKNRIAGGLIVHLDCGRGNQTPSLRVNDSFIVHGVDCDTDKIEIARASISRKGLYGPVSVSRYDGRRLPYSDNLVNVLVSTGQSRLPKTEAARVLVPGGILFADGKIDYVKPIPDDTDEWTHYLHDTDNNAVSADAQVAPLKHLRWDGGPRWSRSHEIEMSMTALVSASGKLIYFIDDGPIGIHETPIAAKHKLPDKASLVARDAYNGVILWKRSVADWGANAFAGDLIKRWRERDRMFASPTVLPRRLAVAGDMIYVTLGFRAPVSELNAITGKTLRTFENTANTEEILVAGKRLYLHVKNASGKRSVVALNLSDGKILWRFGADNISNVTLAVSGGRVFYHNQHQVVAIDSSSGKELWRSPAAGKGKPVGDCSLVLHDDVVIVASGAQARVLSAKDGKKLWEKKGRFRTFRGKPDVFVAGGLLWLGSNTPVGLDVKTGKVARTLNTAGLFTPGHHTRCYRARATENFLLWSKRGVEFMDLDSDKHRKHDWVRGTCRYGIMPANGLLYTPPTPCFCFPGVKKNGFNAFSGKDLAVTSTKIRTSDADKGPAFGKIAKSSPTPGEDWPTYRHDNARSGYIAAKVPVKLKEAWWVKLGGSITPPVVAGGRLYVSQKDTHTICCLDAETGKSIWRFVAGGSVDSPPTVHRGRVIFGCTDGVVYCLNSADGKVAWSFTAAPCDKRIISYGKLQSAWPVCGSVLVEKGVVYFAAGISSYFDGGIYMYALNADTGAIVHSKRLNGTDLKLAGSNKRPHDMDGARNDILVSNGSKLFLTQNVFDMSLKTAPAKRIGRYGALETDLHLVASGGFLDDSGFDRLYWMYARRWPGLYYAVSAPKAGQILVFDAKRTYGLHKFNKKFSRSPYFAAGTGSCELFADNNDNEPVLAKKQEARERGTMSREKEPAWSVQVPVNARAMVLAGKILFFAGTPDVIPVGDPLAGLEERIAGKLWAVSAADGKKLAEYEIDSPPVFDGLISAGGKLYIVTRDGKVRCWK